MPKVSEQYREVRRTQIIEAAREVFSRQGLARTSMTDLVTATGMSMGALYRYFASKEELIAAVAEGRDGTVRGDFVAESPDELLARLLSHVSGAEGVPHARLSAQIWGEAAIRPAVAEMARVRHTALRDHLVACLRDTRGAEGTADPEDADVADVVLAALVGYANLVAAGFDVDPARFQPILDRLLPAQRP